MTATLISDLAVVIGITLVVVGLYVVAMIAVTANRNHDDRVISGEPKKPRKNRR